jgi:hypothetical protein
MLKGAGEAALKIPNSNTISALEPEDDRGV